MRLVVLQSNYVPWKGYFDLLGKADLFVIYDSVQYTKNDWRNRNFLLSPQGRTWLTIPVQTSGKFGQPINEVTVLGGHWSKKHWKTISQQLQNRPYFSMYAEEWSNLYLQCANHTLLHDVNTSFLKLLSKQLGLTTPMVDDREFVLNSDDPSSRLVELCRSTGADTYLTGPAGLNYLDINLFVAAGIAVELIDYSKYRPYLQGKAFIGHAVSVLDLLASVGPDARSHLNGEIQRMDR